MKTAFFSIASSKQLANAKVLLDSIKENHPEAETFLVLAERSAAASEISTAGRFDHSIVSLDQMGISDLEKLAFQYNADEFNGALKPWSLDYFLERFESVIYFDPDVELFSKPAEILKFLTENEAVITPCATAPPPDDGLFPSNTDLLRVGQFHSGFFAVRSSPQTRKFARYWEEKVGGGLATIEPFEPWMGNQLLFSSITSFVGPVMIARSEAYHFSVWNFSQRQLSIIDGQLMTPDGPLVSLNFQGLSRRHEKLLGQPQWARRRFLPTTTPIRESAPSVKLDEILKAHEAKLRDAQNKLEPYSKNYSFGSYLTGDTILQNDRRIFLHMSSYEKRQIGDPFQAKDKIRKRHLTISKLKSENLLREFESIKQGYESIKSGPSWKIGRAITWPLRSIKSSTYSTIYFFRRLSVGIRWSARSKRLLKNILRTNIRA